MERAVAVGCSRAALLHWRAGAGGGAAPSPHPLLNCSPACSSFFHLSQVGLRYFGDLQRKIPRAEVAQIEAVAREACLALVGAWAARRLSMPQRPPGCLPA